MPIPMMSSAMKIGSSLLALSAGFLLLVCSTQPCEFGVYRQSDGTVEVHAPKPTKDTEAQAATVEECKN
jgi:hypothetical protein